MLGSLAAKLSAPVIKFMVKKYAMGWLIDLWKTLDGKRTQTSALLAGLVLSAGFMGLIEMERAWDLAAAVGGAGAFAFLEKLRRHKSVIEELSSDLRQAAVRVMVAGPGDVKWMPSENPMGITDPKLPSDQLPR